MFSGKEKTMNSQENVPNHNRQQSPVSSAGLSFWAVVVCLATLLSLASSTVAQDEWLGVAGGPPDKDPNKHADKINQKLDKVHGNLEKLLNTAIASDQIFDSNQVQYFKNQKDRSKKNKDRFHKQGGFKQVGKKKNFKNNKDEYDPNEFEVTIYWSMPIPSFLTAIMPKHCIWPSQNRTTRINARNSPSLPQSSVAPLL
jgi:hypothetical protein